MNRRDFISGIAAAAGGSLLLPASMSAAEGAPETTSITLAKTPALCNAPQFIAEELLRAEGFTEIRFVEMIAPEVSSMVGLGRVDFNMHFAPQWVSVIDGGAPVTVLSGVHVGCVELFGKEGIRSIADLKGKTVGVPALGSPDHLFVSVPRASLPHACIHRHRSRRHPTLPRRGASPFRASRRTPA